MVDPGRTYVDAAVHLAPDVTLLPGTMLQGRTVVGRGARLGPNVRLVDCAVGEGAVGRETVGHDAEIGPRSMVGPFAVAAPGTHIPPGATTGPSTLPGEATTRASDRALGHMELIPKKRLQLYAGRSHPGLAEDIAAHLGVELGEANLSQFANGEMHCRFGESIRGSDVFIIQTHCGPVNDTIMEQLIMIDAAKRASAKRITAVCPFYGYSRQDRKAAGREPITAKLVADMLMTAGVDRVVSVDLHSGQIQGFFDVPVDHLTAMPVLTDYLRSNLGNDVVIVSPDAGRMKVAERFAQHVDADLASVYKRRPRRGRPGGGARGHGRRGRPGLRAGRRHDRHRRHDLRRGREAHRHGATEVYAMATHGVLSDPAIDRLKNSLITKVVITDTIPLPTTAASTRSRCSRWPTSSPTPSTPSSRTRRCRRSSAAKTKLDIRGALPPHAPPSQLL